MMATRQAPRIVNRTHRAKLIPRRDPYWHLIADGQHLGYRKGQRGGTWIARYYRTGKGRLFQSLGHADDTAEADGHLVLSFSQAVEAAQKFVSNIARADHAGVRIGRYTVAEAAEDWLQVFSGSEGSRQTSAGNIRNYILPVLGDVEVERLTRQQVQGWLHATSAQPTVRSSKATSKKLVDMSDPETQRRRRESANRVLNDLKALLTMAYRNQRVSSKVAWDTVEPIPNTSAVRKATLELEEALRLMDECEADFSKMVRAALATGCRWGELCLLRVQDFDSRARLLTVKQEKTGKLKHIALNPEDVAFFSEEAASKAPDQRFFLRADGKPWGKSDQQVRMQRAVRAAGIKERVTFHGLRHTVGRWLAESNLPMAMIAKHLGHTNSRVTEEFYAHYSPSHLHDTIRASKPSLKLIKGGAKPKAG